VLLIDSATHRLYVIDMTTPEPTVRARLFVRLGVLGAGKKSKGDMRSPVGIFRIVDTLKQPVLDTMYGDFAWVLDYPNPNDRMLGRGGSEIWIHGSPPNLEDRMPLATEGCFALSNGDLVWLRQMVDPARTLVISASSAEWIPPSAWRDRRDQVGSRPLASYFQPYRGMLPVEDPVRTIVSTDPKNGYVWYQPKPVRIAEQPAPVLSDARPCALSGRQAVVRAGGATMVGLDGGGMRRNLRSATVVDVIRFDDKQTVVSYDGQVGTIYAPLLASSCASH
jgi:hypothetical protein